MTQTYSNINVWLGDTRRCIQANVAFSMPRSTHGTICIEGRVYSVSVGRMGFVEIDQEKLPESVLKLFK